MSAWQEIKLGDAVSFGNGKERPKTEGNIPVFGGNGILGYCDKANYQNETIIIGRVGAYCGSVFFEHNPIWVSDNALAAKPKNGYNAKFLYYFLKNLQLNSFAEGSSHPLVTQKLLNSIDIRITIEIAEQKRISETLSSLDDKIDLLHRQNKTLEALAEMLFRQWFVVEAEESWEVGTLDDVISIKGGTTPSTSKSEFWDGGIHWTSPRDLSNTEFIYLFDTERKITERGLKEIGSGLLPIGTVLLSSRAPIGYLAITEIPVAINQGYIAIICDKLVSNHFIYLWCKANMPDIENAGNGSVFQEISKSTFKTLEIKIPPKEKLKSFDNMAEPLFRKIKSNSKQIKTLTQLRDTLLPKLMSGEVKVESMQEELDAV